MADYDSDSSGAGNDVETNVLLGYASKEPTEDDFSQLGGHPRWLDGNSAPSGSLKKCKVCNEPMCLLLQLYGDLLDRFPGHERRLYILGCRRKLCRRKEGSVRAFRALRMRTIDTTPTESKGTSSESSNPPSVPNLGDALFGSKSTLFSQSNPFSSSQSQSSSSSLINPFSSAKGGSGAESIATNIASENDLPKSFADKARISLNNVQQTQPSSSVAPEPWTADPKPYPSYHLDADREYLYSESEDHLVPSNARVDNEGESSSAADEKSAFESAMDKTFQRFADRLSQNPEQVLRYEFGGEPLLYSKTDSVGKKLAPAPETKVQTVTSKNGSNIGLRIPRCNCCGAGRVFELQLTPHAITELEAEEASIDGMEWGTVIVGVCSADCQERGKTTGEVGYVEEWVGVQWEELADHRKR